MQDEAAPSKTELSGSAFRKRFLSLILASWNIPPVIGLSFLLFIGMFSPQQMSEILTTPLEPAFIVAWVLFSIWYFDRFARPIADFLKSPEENSPEAAIASLRLFPLHYWGLFLAYLLMAPFSVIIAAQMYTDFVPQPMDWLRIHLIALIVSIVVGLPIFFTILDLFGRAMHRIPLTRPHVSIKMKVFLIGALVPLLIDTMLVQYFWARTGYFTFETFIVWLALELLAVVGSLIFVRSIGQSLAPLESTFLVADSLDKIDLSGLVCQSTDELGVLAKNYRRLVGDLHVQTELLQLNNQLLGVLGQDISLENIADTIVDLSGKYVVCDVAFLILFDERTQQLVGVAQTNQPFKADGYFRLNLDEVSMAVLVFQKGETFVVNDVQNDPRCSPRMRQRFTVQSALASPLMIEAKPIGVLMTVCNEDIHHYSLRERLITEGFARDAAMAIHTQRLKALRLEAENKGAEREQLVQLLMNSTEEAIYGVDLNGICTFVNPACVRMLGYQSEHELLGKNLHDLIHHTFPDGSHYPKQQCKVRLATLEGVSGHSSDEVHWRKDGSCFPVEYWSHPIKKDGITMGTVVSFIDITERLQAEQSRLQSEAKYRALFESAGDAIFIMRQQYNIDCNQKTLDLFGCKRDQFIGKTPKDFSPELQPDGRNSVEKANELIEKAYQGEPQFFEWHCRRPDGSTFYVEINVGLIEIGGEGLLQVIVRDVSERKLAEEKIRQMAFHDVLTGLVNRHEFEDRLANALESVKIRGMEHALLYLDLDQFKVINDTCGHAAGDELLKQLPALLHEPVRERDTVARLGGDEFGILMENCPLDRAMEIANQLVRKIREYRFSWEGKTFSVGVSIGVAPICDPDQSLGDALKTADIACYMSKELGRNRAHLFDQDDSQLLQRETEMGLVAHIHDALDYNRFKLYGQSIVALGSPPGNQKFIEIFVRMLDRNGNVSPPEAFIASAERYNLMPEVDRWVIRNAFDFSAQFVQPEAEKDLVFFINLSGTSLSDESFFTFVQQQLSEKKIDPSRICFEVTETAAIANINRAKHFINAIKTLGCRFALDDFGSGLSSFTYLKELPVDYLKIDGSFVRDMVSDFKDYSIVEAIAQVGRSMGIQTIAEFVEDDQIMKKVQEIGVDFAQGYAIEEPQPLENRRL